MSRRPISSQGRAKPDVKSYPTRPQTSVPRPNKPLDPLEADEEEYKRLNEELNKEFPEISKQYEAMMDPSNPLSIEDLVKKMGNFSVPAKPASAEEMYETFNRLIPQSGGDESIPNFAKLLETHTPTDTVDVLGGLQDKGSEYMQLNEELNRQNSSMMEDCRALLMKLNPKLELNFEQKDEARLEPINSTDLDTLMAREKEYRRMDEELDKKNMGIAKRAEALLAKQRKKKSQTSTKFDRKPPQVSKSVRTRSIVDKPPNQPVAHSNTAGTRTDSEDSLDALREEIMSGTDFAGVIRRIEERVMKINSSPDQPTPGNQPIDPAKTSVPEESELATSRAEESRDSSLSSARPATAPAPIPRRSAGVRANDPIRDIEPPDEVGTEALQRFLKAKLNVLKEELDRASEEIAQKDAELQECKKELLSKQEHSLQLDKQVTSLRSQTDKQQKKLDLVTNELDNSKLEVAGLKRDLDSQVRNQKKTDSTQTAVEVRLNRALEETEKHKSTIQHLKSDTKDTQQSSNKRLEELQTENKILFKQREELLTGFKKQMKLIDNLKRQKMHIEAAKMLAFSEEEFMRVLDWWKVSD